MTTEQIAEREAARLTYIEWVERACRRCENSEVERPPTVTISVAQQMREREECWA